ncbi:MAG: two-component system, NarL family, sensor histidine kinase DesK [Micromonosporaceae bacterium]|nr:two-component system, NarL family, sensor histidine kinase DesK [Micromonosporaceae bacterium]
MAGSADRGDDGPAWLRGFRPTGEPTVAGRTLRTRAERSARAVGGLAWLIVWMFPLANPIGAVVGGQVSPRWPAAAGLALFVSLYLIVVIAGFGRIGTWRNRVAGLAVLAAIGVALAATYTGQPGSWLDILLFVSVAAAATLRSWSGAIGVAVVGATVLTIGVAHRQSAGALSGSMFSVVMSGALVLVVSRMIGLIDELRATRRALAEAAVAEERLRFARDLHDLLGHTLSVIVVKAEVARRVAGRDPGAAVTQAIEIEQIGRQALTEIREAVTGYRTGGLSQELERARASLRDAGIEPTVHTTGPALPGPLDALLTWAVREGVTNVIRHSRARTCRIEVGLTRTRAYTVISDDGGGPGCPADPPRHASAGSPPGGNGLRGLTERMSAVGGTVSAGAGPGTGYRLAVELPVNPAPTR